MNGFLTNIARAHPACKVVLGRSLAMDVIIEYLARFAEQTYVAANGPLPTQIAVVALGGYGRAELCPFTMWTSCSFTRKK